MGKKIAIFTQPLGHNYGGIIQNYALQQVLIKLGHQPTTINRRNAETKYSLFELVKIEVAYKIKYRNRLPIVPRVLSKVYRNTIEFLNKNISISKKIVNNDDLVNYMHQNKFDVYLVGSDQTWRPKYSPNITTYFFDFLKDKSAKRISYAASFGTDECEYTQEQLNACKPLLQQFDAISVREDSGVKLCQDYFGVEASHVLDPTLLLTASDYDKVINRSKSNKGLFTYILDKSIEKQEFLLCCAKTLGLNIFSNQVNCELYKQRSNNIDDYIMPPLEGWLQGFRDAEFVITDSFHGTVFSIINQKPFIAIVNKERGASRFSSLLELLGLENRMVEDVSKIPTSLLVEPIDYSKVNEKLNLLKQDSLQYLENAINN